MRIDAGLCPFGMISLGVPLAKIKKTCQSAKSALPMACLMQFLFPFGFSSYRLRSYEKCEKPLTSTPPA